MTNQCSKDARTVPFLCCKNIPALICIWIWGPYASWQDLLYNMAPLDRRLSTKMLCHIMQPLLYFSLMINSNGNYLCNANYWSFGERCQSFTGSIYPDRWKTDDFGVFPCGLSGGGEDGTLGNLHFGSLEFQILPQAWRKTWKKKR